jgi:hypothetical protein
MGYGTWDMEHGCNRQCKRVKERLSLKSKKRKKHEKKYLEFFK